LVETCPDQRPEPVEGLVEWMTGEVMPFAPCIIFFGELLYILRFTPYV
jgi:hypothetical protein